MATLVGTCTHKVVAKATFLKVSYLKQNVRFKITSVQKQRKRMYKSQEKAEEGIFPVFKIKGKDAVRFDNDKGFQRRQFFRFEFPEKQRMKSCKNWVNVWPTAGSFKQSVVPIPLRQGIVRNSSENEGIIPSKYANLELMKVPNFLHLTPVHVETHCNALKAHCTEWPTDVHKLNTLEYFPLTISSSDYCFAGPSIRDERARAVTLKIALDSLKFSDRARDKFLDLVGDKYNPKTGFVTLTFDRCPSKKQNEDFLMYMLTALYQESWVCQPWEDELKTFEDYREYIWNNSPSAEKVLKHIERETEFNKNSDFKDKDKEAILDSPAVKDYGNAIKRIADVGENKSTLAEMEEAVLKLLNVKLDSNNETEETTT